MSCDVSPDQGTIYSPEKAGAPLHCIAARPAAHRGERLAVLGETAEGRRRRRPILCDHIRRERVGSGQRRRSYEHITIEGKVFLMRGKLRFT